MSENVIYKLEDQGDKLHLDDMSYQFVYNRVKDPDGNDTPYYSLSYKEKDQPVWSTVNGLLSSKFTACQTEGVIRNIVESLNAEMTGEKHFQDAVAVKSSFTLKGYDLGEAEIDETDKLIFKLLTNVDVDDIKSRTGLAFHIINGFAGNLALQLNYGFFTFHYGKDKDNKMRKLGVSNVFILDEFSHRLVHDGTLEVSFSQVEDVKAQCAAKVQEFKDTPVSNEFLEKINKRSPKTFVTNFTNVFEEIPNEYRNMYWASFVWSSLLQSQKDVHKEMHMRRLVKEYMQELRDAKAKSSEEA